MRAGFIGVLVLLVAVSTGAPVAAQERPSAEESLENLKLQLIDLQAKEEQLHDRLEQLNRDLQPENIERALAGIGSTKPEDLREQRRRQLTFEKENVMAQLKGVEEGRKRIEAAIAETETRAYHESASKQRPPTNLLFKSDYWNFTTGSSLTAIVLLALVTAALLLFMRKR